MFYNDIKEHMSPSALAQWMNGRSGFVKSYFEMEKGPETKAMTAGTEIHALIEAGIIKAKHVYDCNELTLKIPVGDTKFWFLGKPDSFESESHFTNDQELEYDKEINFVDYKSGKASDWEKKLPTDIKMRATAWLVWRQTGMPGLVHGHIEFIQTTWDAEQKKVVPVDGKETEVVSITYTAKELEAFTKVIVNTMQEVNDFYEKWKLSTGDFVSSADVNEYVQLKNEIEEKEAVLAEILERIQGQMEFGGVENHKTNIGSFFIKETSTYNIPKELEFRVGDKISTLEMAGLIAAAASAAITNYKLVNEPVSVSRKVQFRTKKEKV